MTNGNLGYMTRESFDRLPDEDKLWYLYDAAVNRCAECKTTFDGRYERKRGLRWQAMYVTILAAAGLVGGFLAQALGFPVPGKH